MEHRPLAEVDPEEIGEEDSEIQLGEDWNWKQKLQEVTSDKTER